MSLAKTLIYFESLHSRLAGLGKSFLTWNHVSCGRPAVRLRQIRISLCVSRLQLDGPTEIHHGLFEAIGSYLRRIIAAPYISVVGFRVRRLDARQTGLLFRG